MEGAIICVKNSSALWLPRSCSALATFANPFKPGFLHMVTFHLSCFDFVDLSINYSKFPFFSDISDVLSNRNLS